MTTHHHAHHGGGHTHGAHAHGAHTHTHAPATFGTAFAAGVALNGGFVVIEAVAGTLGHSTALLSDAGHNVGDVLGLLVAWLAGTLARRSPTPRFTYGLRGSSILAALFNAVVLLLIVGALSLQAVQRLYEPAPVASGVVMGVAAAGAVLNGVTAWLFASGRDRDINLRAVFAHMVGDALVSVGVVAAGALIALTGRLWIDPLASLAVNAGIVAGTWGVLRDSVTMALQAVPPGIDPREVRAFLLARPGVGSLHDLHIWSMSTTDHALTAHLVMPAGPPGDAFLLGVADDLEEHFGIGHATLQIEARADLSCRLAAEGSV